MPVRPVRPDWMVDSDFMRDDVINSTPVTSWDKMDHYYHESAYNPKRPVRVFSPIDNKGDNVQEDYANFLVGEVKASDFEIPRVCETNYVESTIERLRYEDPNIYYCILG